MTTVPISWTAIENVIGSWIQQSSGYAAGDVRLATNRDLGEARGPTPTAQISLLSVVTLSEQGSRTMPQVVQVRVRVNAIGPGTAGVAFYPGHSLTATTIEVVAGVGDPAATTAAALLFAISGALPAGYSAALDPLDSTAVLISGSAAEPLFAGASSAGATISTVTTPIPRWPKVVSVLVRLVWRIAYRAYDVSGAAQATNAMMRAQTLRQTLLDPPLLALGFERAGTLSSQPSVAADRSESVAVLDFAIRGRMTAAVAATAMRAACVRKTSLAS